MEDFFFRTACKAMKIGKNAIYGLLSTKKLKSYRNGRVWRIPKKAIEEYLASQKAKEEAEKAEPGADEEAGEKPAEEEKKAEETDNTGE